MDPDRFQQNSKLFIISLVSLLLCLTLFALALYILPFLIWNWSYKVPEMVLVFREWLKESYSFSEIGASWSVFFVLIIPALIFGFIAQWASNYIENKMYHLRDETTEEHEEVKKGIQESLGFGLKILILISLVVLGIILVEWLVAPPTF